jgi:NAD(P)-dependent dehydrogenase (short-subunit alcohol dehydrogenase family)
MMEISLQNKVAIVTGAGKGTGAVVAQEFAKAGANIVLVARTQSDLDNVAAGVTELGRQALTVSADVTDKDQVDDMVKQATDKFGRIDILVNVAGGILFMKNLNDVSLEEWNGTVSLNLTAVFLCSQAVGRIMIMQKAGRIISISSTASYNGYFVSPHYGAAKAGLNSLTESMADGWAQHNINVNAIAPGLIATEAMKGYGILPPETKEDGTPVPLALLPSTPKRIAHLAIFLASDSAGHITGQVITTGHKARMRQTG